MGYRVNAGPIPADHWIQDPVQGGGRIIGEVCHFVDLMQFVCGADPVEVFATCVGGRDAAQLPQDNLMLQIAFADGSVGSVCYVAHAAKSLPKERLEVSGAGRTGVLDNFSSVELFSGGKPTRTRCPGSARERLCG